MGDVIAKTPKDKTDILYWTITFEVYSEINSDPASKNKITKD